MKGRDYMDSSIFSNHLKNFRKNKTMTQDELGELLFVSRKTISKWETERGLPEIYMLEPISDLLGITIDELIKPKDNDEKNKFIHFYERNLKHKKDYIITTFVLMFLSSTMMVASDIPLLINEKLKNISIILFSISTVFIGIGFIFNYQNHALTVKNQNYSKYQIMFQEINKHVLSMIVILIIYVIAKYLMFLDFNKNLLTKTSIISAIIYILLAIGVLILNLKEINYYGKNK